MGALSFRHKGVLELVLIEKKKDGVYDLTYSLKEELEHMKDCFILLVRHKERYKLILSIFHEGL